MRKRPRRYLIHFIAECHDCDYEEGDFVKGPRRASAHAKKTGHWVTCEYGIAADYNQRDVK